MIAADPYGKFIPGPERASAVRDGSGLVEGNPANPVPVPANVVRIGTAFLNDIAHSAGPGSIGEPKTPDADLVAGGSLDTPVPAGDYDNELLDLHFICGDGRCNENIAPDSRSTRSSTASTIASSTTSRTCCSPTPAGSRTSPTGRPHSVRPNGTGVWNGERLFQAARFVTEMQYQHLVFEEFARKVQPGINPFEPFAFNQTDVDPAITAEFAHAVYRFGHSMLTDTIAPQERRWVALTTSRCSTASSTRRPTTTTATDSRPGRRPTSIIMGHVRPGRQRTRRVRGRDAAQQPARACRSTWRAQHDRARSEGVPSLNNVRTSALRGDERRCS